MGKKGRSSRFGDLPPKYHFSLNPYPDLRCSRCPNCRNKTGQRKLPLLIHIDPKFLIALNYTNRYCRHCDMLIAHKHELDHHLTELFLQTQPESIGNDYLVLGTVEKRAWRENMTDPKLSSEMTPHISDFISHQEIRTTESGWFPKGVEPPLRIPPPPTEWVKKEGS